MDFNIKSPMIIFMIIITIVIIIGIIRTFKNINNTINAGTTIANEYSNVLKAESQLMNSQLSSSSTESKLETKISEPSEKPEEQIEEPEIKEPEELTQAEILKAQIMEEVLTEQKKDFDETLNNELITTPFDNEDVKTYFDNTSGDESIQNFKLITIDNIIVFKLIIPAYNPTNGAHFIYAGNYWILKDNYNDFRQILDSILQEIKLNDHVIKTGSIRDDKTDYMLFKTYTNTSTPTYQLKRINKNLDKQFNTIYIVNEDAKIYTYQGNVSKYIDILNSDVKNGKIETTNLKGFNISAYEIKNDKINDYIINLMKQ